MPSIYGTFMYHNSNQVIYFGFVWASSVNKLHKSQVLKRIINHPIDLLWVRIHQKPLEVDHQVIWLLVNPYILKSLCHLFTFLTFILIRKFLCIEEFLKAILNWTLVLDAEGYIQEGVICFRDIFAVLANNTIDK